MEISRAHRIRLVPNKAQETYFKRACGIRRLAYNWALAEWNKQYEESKANPKNTKKPSKFALAKQFNDIKREQYPYITEVSARISERAIHDVGTAWSNYFKALKRGDKRTQRPRFAKRGVRDRFYVHNQELEFDDKRVRIGKFREIGWIRTREALRFEGKIMGATVRRIADQWYLSVQVTFPHGKEPHPVGGSIGMDMGVALQVATSEGECFQLPVEQMKKVERQIRRAQKTLSRRWNGKIKKGHADKALRDENGQLRKASNRFHKQADRLARLHMKLANIRSDALHRLSSEIVARYEMIAIENLRVSNMTRSARGTVEAPGRNVRAKSGLNRAMLNASLRQFRLMLEYKSEAAGGYVIAVDPAHTSQTCSKCGHKDAGNRPSQAVFCCLQCDHRENADINAARNILQKAQVLGQ